MVIDELETHQDRVHNHRLGFFFSCLNMGVAQMSWSCYDLQTPCYSYCYGFWFILVVCAVLIQTKLTQKKMI